MSRLRVLSVDDHPLLRNAVAALSSSQSEMTLVGESSNGQEVIEQFRKHSSDVTVLDLQMPVMTGLVLTTANPHPSVVLWKG